MSAQELTFGVGDLTVAVAENGLPVRVHHAARPGQNYLAPQEPGRVTVAGDQRAWEFVGMITDTDESEVRYCVADLPEVEYTVRNSFTGSWIQRHMLQNTSSTPIRIDELVLPLSPGSECVGWGLAAGADSSWVIQPADGRGPLLTGALTQGVALAHTTEPGFRVGEVTLQGGRRLVLQWQITTADAVTEIVRHPAPMMGPRTELPLGEPYEIDDPDIAVIPPDAVSVESDGPTQLVVSDCPGRFPVELRSARGTSTVDLAWVPPVDRVITERTREWLSRERSGAGIGLIRGGGAALSVQQAVIDRLTEEPEAAEDALELYTARLLEHDRLSIMDTAFLAQESIRTGDRDPVNRAREEFFAAIRFEPGLGLAALRILVAELTGGGAGEGILPRLHQLRPADPSSIPVGDDQLLAMACRLESIATTGPTGSGRAEDARLLDAVRTVGTALGFGLSGRRLGTLSPSVAVYAAAVLDLLPEGAVSGLAEEWGASQQLLAERSRTSALAALLWPTDSAGEDDLDHALGWMVLGRPIE